MKTIFFNVLGQWRVHSCPVLFLKWVLSPPEIQKYKFQKMCCFLIVNSVWDRTCTNGGSHCLYVLFWKWFKLNEVKWGKEVSVFIMYCLLFLVQRMKDEWPIKLQSWHITKRSRRLCYVYKIIFNLYFCQEGNK